MKRIQKKARNDSGDDRAGPTNLERVLAVLREHSDGCTLTMLAQATGIKRKAIHDLFRYAARNGEVIDAGLVTEQTRAGRRQVRVWRLPGQSDTRLLDTPLTQANRLVALADNHLRGDEYADVREWLKALANEIRLG